MKYIDADKLIAKIESISLFPQISADYNDGREDMKMMVLDLIDSLQKEQMMKDAVEATVMATKCGDKYQQLLISDWNPISDMRNGDKVKLIILKDNT